MQPYRAQAADSPFVEKESHIGHHSALSQSIIAGNAALRDYEAKQNQWVLAVEFLNAPRLTLRRLSTAIDSTTHLVADLKNFNGDSWQIRYPHFSSAPPSSGPRGTFSRNPQFLCASAGC